MDIFGLNIDMGIIGTVLLFTICVPLGYVAGDLTAVSILQKRRA